MTEARRYELTPLEVASGLVFGLAPTLSTPTEVVGEPIEAFERAILPALRRPPCIVSFSGGRDSSAVLAAAVRLARREGLPLPIPSTNRFPAVKDSHESDWQERVVAHLGLHDWLRPEFTGELDCVGPVATSVLRRHGLLWPFNAHFHVPHLEAAAGGSLLTGIGGDEILSSSSWARPRAVLSGRARPQLRDVLRVGFLAAPPPIRRTVLRRRAPFEYSWLRPSAHRALGAGWAAHAASEPFAWEAQFGWRLRFRYLHVGARQPGRAGRRRLALGSCTRSPTRGSRLRSLGSRSRADTRTARRRCASCSATSFPTTCSPARPSPASTRPSGATGAAPWQRTGAARGPTRSSSTSKRFGRSGALLTPIRARSRSCKPHGWPKISRIRALCELVLRPVPLRSRCSYR